MVALIGKGTDLQESKQSMAKNNDSQDVYLVEKEDGVVELDEGSHIGHVFFRSLAELNRIRFIQSLERDQNSAIAERMALSVVSSVCSKGKAKIFLKSATDRASEEWEDVGNGQKAKMCVFRAMKTLFDVNHNSPTAVKPDGDDKITNNTIPDMADDVSRKRSHSYEDPVNSVVMIPSPHTKRRCRSRSDGIAQVIEAGEEHQLTPAFMNSTARATSLDSHLRQHYPPRTGNPLEANPTGLAHPLLLRPILASSLLNPHPLVVSQTHVHFPNLQTPPLTGGYAPPPLNALELSGNSIRAPDVLCGGRGVGVLKSKNAGNVQFMAFVESKLNEFAKAGTDEQVRIAESLQRTVQSLGGRFMAQDSSGIYKEIPKSMGISKALLTMQARVEETKPKVPTQGVAAASSTAEVIRSRFIMEELNLLNQRKEMLEGMLLKERGPDPDGRTADEAATATGSASLNTK